MKIFKPVLNKTYLFKGCVWNAHWEFDCPAIIYSPVQRYFDNCGSICKEVVEGLVEDVCIDICLKGQIDKEFNVLDKKVFKWRGWSLKGFGSRKSAVHAIVPVVFKMDKDGMIFEYGERAKK